MFQTVEIPVWVMVLIAVFAALSILERVIGPSIRWFLRKRAERVVAEVNKRLQRPIEPFKLARRTDMIQRLKYDPEVAEAIVEHARTEGVREDVAFEQVEQFAREIVPSFSATAYFGFGTRVSKWFSHMLYRVRLGAFDQGQIATIDHETTVVFVMNHRSNMDYLLVTWLVADRSALSYAVGEWARVWPLSTLIRSMGAFFIRRRSRSALYRKVLSRYVQMATQGGVTQAVFPEGGLSLDGRMAEPKLGFLSYIVTGYRPEGRDVVFVPVALNYDRVLEDRVLVEANQSGERRFRAAFPTAIAFALRQFGRKLRGRFLRFGFAAVSFGEPVSLSTFHSENANETTRRLGIELKRRIEAIVPVLPVPLIASVLESQANPVPRAALLDQAQALHARITSTRAHAHISPAGIGPAVEKGLAMLLQRKIVTEGDAGIMVGAGQEAIAGFYANSIRHLVDAGKAGT
ncbi:MAG: 1-acyl-sn-glycerol-3-phosphate acyltransferase [Silicimonas sp.]|nr:1-acyl-sn-glycerol-3-phosphate acyltransferase [Silicimonas sp.]